MRKRLSHPAQPAHILWPSFFLLSARLALCGSVSCAAFKEKLSTAGGSWNTSGGSWSTSGCSWNTAEDHVLATLPSVARITVLGVVDSLHAPVFPLIHAL